MINVKDVDVLGKIKLVFPEEPKQEKKETDYDFFYVIKAVLLKPVIQNWGEAGQIFNPEGAEIDEDAVEKYVRKKLLEGISYFNNRSLERKLDLVDISEIDTSLLFLLSCKGEQEKAQVVNKFGSYARNIWSIQEFRKFVAPSTTKQNRLFTLKIKQIDEEFNVLNIIAE
jgi:hypothetical protein